MLAACWPRRRSCVLRGRTGHRTPQLSVVAFFVGTEVRMRARMVDDHSLVWVGLGQVVARVDSQVEFLEAKSGTQAWGGIVGRYIRCMRAAFRTTIVLLCMAIVLAPVTAGTQQLPPGSVVCARSAKSTIYCRAGNTCSKEKDGTWICQPAIAKKSCSACATQQKLDTDACAPIDNLLKQAECVNRANKKWTDCLTDCVPP